MLDCSGLPCVEATLSSGKHLRLLVDTGNADSVIDTEVAKQIGLPTTAVAGSDGKPIAGLSRSTLNHVTLGEASLGDVQALVMDIAGYIKSDRMPRSDGTLAYTAFKDRILQLDYVHHFIGVSAPLQTGVSCPGHCGELTTPTFGKEGPPIVVGTGFLVNERPVTAQIDTLFTGTVLIYPTAVEKLRLVEEARTTTKKFFKYTDGGVEMLEAKANSEAFGDQLLLKDAPLYFTTPQVHLPDGYFDATVGHALLQHSVVSLDFHGMKLWLSE